MAESKSRKKKPPRRVLARPDLEHAKTAILNSLTSASGQRSYDHAIRDFVALVRHNDGHGCNTQTWPYCIVWHDAAEAHQPLAQGCCAPLIMS